MAQSPLAPPPPTGGPLDSWLYLLWRRLTQAGQILWESITPGTSADVAAVVTDETGTAGSLVFSGNPTLQGITDSGNLIFTGTGNRITGNFSNATSANRVMFQSSVENGNTSVAAIPNGTSTTANFRAIAGTDPDNSVFCDLQATSTGGIFRVDKMGTASYTPFGFYCGGGEKMRIDTDGTTTIGGAATAQALKVIPVGSQARWIEVTGATSSTNPTIGVSGGILGITASVAITGVVSTSGYTVATLPAGTVGDRAYVTDALAPAYGVAVAGGGAVTVPVFYNGAAWICA